VIFPSFSYLAALVAFASINPAPFRMDEYHHDGQHAHLLPPYPILVCEDIYYAKPIALHIIGKPVVGDLKRPFEVAGMFGTGAFAIHIISLYLLPCLLIVSGEKNMKLTATMRCPQRGVARTKAVRERMTAKGQRVRARERNDGASEMKRTETVYLRIAFYFITPLFLLYSVTFQILCYGLLYVPKIVFWINYCLTWLRGLN